ncbi:MAG: NUDIX domain-containing protein [Patescibacteria group bacterium]
MMSNKDELIDVVDEKDRVLESVTRREIYDEKLRHRIVHVLVFNENGEMALQLRSKKVDFLPGVWSTAAGGHVLAGENYLQAARRELAEELGIKGRLIEIGKFPYFSSTAETDKFVRFYKLIYKDPIEVENEDVDKVEYFSISRLKKMIKDGDKLHPELEFYLLKI